ncbi:hypothetical protein KPH14_012738 [Odynerus spinipes]|uniref:Peptidase A2 domain-containing protein n=1 Tax=Odynerus spinipes TaxID=1348599 RepID=A0AAD9RG54_9HYME|nr:hypothetical protein KPH14_012738 [Odynerus spinipes]
MERSGHHEVAALTNDGTTGTNEIAQLSQRIAQLETLRKVMEMQKTLRLDRTRPTEAGKLTTPSYVEAIGKGASKQSRLIVSDKTSGTRFLVDTGADISVIPKLPGFSTVQKRCQKVLAKKGKSQVGVVASGERGVNTTFVCCTSASGQYVAPMIIFKRKRMAPDLSEGAPPGSIVEISDTGYINTDLFVTWLKHFIAAVKPTMENKVLLILDGHTTHSRNLTAIELARENGIILLQLPGHTTHRLQPLDVAIFKPLQVYYDQTIEKWLREHSGRAVTQFQIARFIGEAYSRAASIANATSGFRKCGIWPVDRNVHTDADFGGQNDLQTEPTVIVERNDENNNNIPLAVFMQQQKTKPTSLTSQDVSIEDILPFPDLSGSRAGKQAQTAKVLATILYKEELEAKKSRIDEKQSRQIKRKRGQTKKTNEKKKRGHPDNAAVIEINEEEWLCFLCGECKVENMVKCDVCQLWAHELCANVQSNTWYICDKCS